MSFTKLWFPTNRTPALIQFLELYSTPYTQHPLGDIADLLDHLLGLACSLYTSEFVWLGENGFIEWALSGCLGFVLFLSF